MSLNNHQARKRFGQNFLVDDNVIQRIVRAIRPAADQTLVEIGPGQGAITALLLHACPHLQVVELDRDLVPVLRHRFHAYPQFVVHQADALQFDFAALATHGPLRIVGNLPYNISTPLIFHLLSFGDLVQDMHFMLQKEVVERMAAAPGGGDYGRLSVMCQYHCEVESLFEVAPQCFRPVPKVDSAIVRLKPRPVDKRVRALSLSCLDQVVKAAFSQRRKTLRNALKDIATVEEIESVLGDTQLRPERVSVDQFIELANRVFARQSGSTTSKPCQQHD